MAKIILITVLSFATLYILLSFGLAKFMADLVFTPAKKFCPTYAQVRQRKTDTANIEYLIYKDTDFDAYEQWTAEPVVCDNSGVQILGVYHPLEHSRGCVILAHGFGQNRYAMIPFAEIFRSLGFDTLLFDQRRFGQSQAPFGSLGLEEGKDVAALVEWVKKEYGADKKIILHGVSMGAVSSMNALQHTSDVIGVLEDCGFSTVRQAVTNLYRSMVPLPNPFLLPVVMRRAKKLGLNFEKNNPIDAVKNTDVPVCVLHGDADKTVSVQCAKELRNVLKNPCSRVELFQGRGHGFAILDRERYCKIVADFLQAI